MDISDYQRLLFPRAPGFANRCTRQKCLAVAHGGGRARGERRGPRIGHRRSGSLDARAGSPESIPRGAIARGLTCVGLALAGLVGAVLAEADELEEKRHDRRQLRIWLVAAMQALNGRERFIVKERKLRDRPRTLESLGTELGLSKERVRQLEAAAFLKMRKNLENQSREVHSLLI